VTFKKGHKGYWKGKKLTEEAKRNMSLAQKKRKQEISLQFKKLWQNPEFRKKNKGNLGKHHTEETKRKIGLANKGKKNFKGHKHTEETKRKIGLANKGKIRTEEMKKLYSLANKGKIRTEETKKKMSLANKGEKAYNWKGDNVGYRGLHIWIRRNKPKSEFCEKCKKNKKISLSNISGEYKRDINDYKWLCYSCHKKFDLNTKNGKN
jgi:hypothetical protein